jgi:hypothetical protein
LAAVFVYLKNKKMKISFAFLAFFFLSCRDKQNTNGDWVQGNTQQQIKTIEKHFRGLDVAMIEIDYRYRELFWAGKDQNWDYGLYQVDKIKLSLENALERRPKRAASAQHFLQTVLPQIKTSFEGMDTAVFKKDFEMLTLNCNSCHIAEKVPHFNVQPPVERFSSIRKP